MSTLSDLKTAVRRGDKESVREIADELVEDGVMIISALNLAKDLNKTRGRRGQWQDIIDILEEYFE